MRCKLLGKSGLRVSELALGTMTFGEDWGWGASKEESRKIFEAFRQAGGNFIDTANKYTDGSSEKLVGEFIAEDRERFVVATKYSLSTKPGDPNAGGNHRKNMIQAVEASLKRLNTDYIDLYWLHAWDYTTPIEEVMRGLDDLVRAGKILYIGASDKAAIDYLQSRPEVNVEHIVAVGVCQGCSEMLQVVVDDQRVKALAVVSGQYLDRGNKLEFLGEAGLALRLERGKTAQAKFEETGEVEYVPVVDPVRTDVGLPHKPIWDWYHGWADRGIWENRYATISDAQVWSFDSLQAAAQVQWPSLMIHADNSDGPAAAHRHFEAVPTLEKQLIWEGPTNHFQYYEDPVVIDRAAGNIAHWFREHLV